MKTFQFPSNGKVDSEKRMKALKQELADVSIPFKRESVFRVYHTRI